MLYNLNPDMIPVTPQFDKTSIFKDKLLKEDFFFLKKTLIKKYIGKIPAFWLKQADTC